MRDCKVCRSPHVDEYNELYFKKLWDISKIWRYAARKYGETFSYETMRRHFARERMKRDYLIKADRERDEYIRREIEKDIETAKILRRNLELCSAQLEQLKSDMSDPEARKEIREIIGKINQTLELLLRFSDKIESKKEHFDLESFYRRIIKCMEDFPVELVVKFQERWINEFGISSQVSYMGKGSS